MNKILDKMVLFGKFKFGRTNPDDLRFNSEFVNTIAEIEESSSSPDIYMDKIKDVFIRYNFACYSLQLFTIPKEPFVIVVDSNGFEQVRLLRNITIYYPEFTTNVRVGSGKDLLI